VKNGQIKVDKKSDTNVRRKFIKTKYSTTQHTINKPQHLTCIRPNLRRCNEKGINTI